MVTRVLGVHGIGNLQPGRTAEQAAGNLTVAWSAALARRFTAPGSGAVPFDGGPEFDLRCAYYADRLSVPVAQGPGDLGPLPEGGAETLSGEEMIRLWADELGIREAATVQGRATLPVRVLVDLMAERSDRGAGAVRRLVGMFVREVDAYLRVPDSPAREQSRQVVVDALRAHRPRVVIAHSLGSVVTYEALFSAPDVTIDLLVTLGSPLGMNGVVYQRLRPAQRGTRGERPSNVATWVNIADRGDIVAIPMDFRKRFTPDDHVPTSISHFDFHTVRNYLGAAETIAALRSV